MTYQLSYQDLAGGTPSSEAKLSSLVELSVSCRNLMDSDVFSKSDSMCVLYTQEPGSERFHEFERTEMIRDCLNPDFTHKFLLEYRFEEQQHLKFEIYDIDSDSTNLRDHDFLGSQVCSLGEIVAYQGTQLQKKLNGPDSQRDYGTILLVAEELRACKNVAHLQFACLNLKKQVWFGGVDAFFVILKQNNDNSFSAVHKTQVVRGNRNPTFKITISVIQLCNGIYDRPLKFQCFDYASSGSHRLIGEFTTDFQKLSQGPGPENEYECINFKKKQRDKSYKNCGEVKLTLFNLEERHSFLDYIKSGRTQINCTVAIDFTYSNGDPQLPKSLHYIGGATLNPYALAIRSVGEILEDYDSDKQFPALGFGAKLPPDGRLSHDFYLNGHPTNPYCAGVEGILSAYYKSLHTVQLFGPTNFAPVINHVARFAQSYKDGSFYFVLLIITDGIITDMPDTKEAIVTASTLPISIIIVGVGDTDFSAMHVLDGDTVRLSSKGRYAARDIVQFVPFQEFCSGNNWLLNKAALARAVLAEVPDQFLSFMKANNIQPDLPISQGDANASDFAPQ